MSTPQGKAPSTPAESPIFIVPISIVASAPPTANCPTGDLIDSVFTPPALDQSKWQTTILQANSTAKATPPQVESYAKSTFGMTKPVGPGPAVPNDYYVWGGYTPATFPAGNSSSMVALANVSGCTTSFQGGQRNLTFSAYLGGYQQQEDTANVEIDFLTAAFKLITSATLQGPNAGDDPDGRNGVTEMIWRTATVAIPAGTAYIGYGVDFYQDGEGGSPRESNGTIADPSMQITTA